ncbi:MAG: NAD-dependent epimerase/dehydratase family protein [Thiotrichaceae bacterium]
MKILLTGASGFIGHHIKQALRTISAYELITPSHQEVNFNTCVTSEDWLPLLEDIEVVINSVGIITETRHQRFSRLHSQAPIDLFQACEQSNVKHVIQISALGADKNAFTPYQKSKLAADNALRQSTLSWSILRPSLVYGESGKSLAMFKRLASLPLIPLPDAGKQYIQPVHVSDLVATVMRCLHQTSDGRDSPTHHQTIDVVGLNAMTLADYLQAIRVSAGKTPAKIIPIPYSLAMRAARIVRYVFPAFSMMHPDNLRMLQQGNTADVAPLTTFLGRPPLSLEEGLKRLETNR